MVGMSLKIKLLLLGLVWFPGQAVAAPGDPTTIPELIAAVEATYASATSIRADFVQIQKSGAMGTEDRQHGRLSAERPRKLRVETGPPGLPAQSTMVSNGKTLWIYNARDKQVIEMPELGAGNDMGILLEDLGKLGALYDVTLLPQNPPKPSFTVQLVPKKAGAIKSLQLTLSKQKFLVQNLVLINQMNDVTEMNFTMVRMNQDIPDGEFTFVAPPGVTLTKTGAP